MGDSSQMMAFFNGSHIPHSEAVSKLKEAESQKRGSLYDAERTFDGRVFMLREHLERLYRSLSFAQVDPGMSIEEMEEATLALLEANRSLLKPDDDFVLRQVVSLKPAGDTDGQSGIDVVIDCRPIDFPSFAQSYVNGVRVVTPITYASASHSFTATPEEAAQQTFSLRTDDAGNITECNRANFMFVKDGRIKLPDRKDVLKGLSMETTLELAGSLGVPVDEGTYTTADVYQAAEAFATGTSYCLLPVATINGLRLHRELPGPIGGGLLEAWQKHVGKDFVMQAMSFLSSDET